MDYIFVKIFDLDLSLSLDCSGLGLEPLVSKFARLDFGLEKTIGSRSRRCGLDYITGTK